MIFRLFPAIMLLSIIFVSVNCTNKPPMYPGSSQGVNSSDNSDPNDGTGDYILKLSFSDEKFQELDATKLRYRASMGSQVEQGNLRFSDGQAVVTLTNLPSHGHLKVEFFEDEQVQLIAEKKDLLLAEREASFKIANCRIQPLNWNGMKHSGNCNWKISEVP